MAGKKEKFWTAKKILTLVGSIASIGVLIVGYIGISNWATSRKQKRCEHEYVIIETLEAATCETDGRALYKCELCEKETEETVAAFGHTEVLIEKQDPTCNGAGWLEYTACETCGIALSDKYELKALGHNPETLEAKRATCFETGLTEGSYCIRCEEILVEQEVLPILKHSYVTMKGYPATCDKDGLTDGTKCEYCETVFVAQERIPALKHSLEFFVGKEPTCTESGNEAYEACKREGCNYTTYVEIEANGHSYDENKTCTTCGYTKPADHVCDYEEKVLKNPTCTEAGEARYTCECSDSYTAPIELVGHSEDEGTVTKKAKCEEAGEKVYTCQVCQAQRTEAIEATGHDYTVTEVAATCETDGYKKSVCGLCGAMEQENYTKLGHKYVDDICTVCGAEYFSEGLAYTEIDGSYIVTSIGECTDTEIKIPAIYKGLPVTAIDDSAFGGRTAITSVIIPESVTSIGNHAFYNCENLSSVQLPANLTKIQTSVFNGCKSLRYVEIPYGVTEIETAAFQLCHNLSTVDIPDTVKKIGTNAFRYCPNLHFVQLPSDVPEMAENYADIFRDINPLACVFYCKTAQSKAAYQEAMAWNVDNFSPIWISAVSTDKLGYELSADGTQYKVINIGAYTDSDLVIPNYYKGLPVTSIEYQAFREGKFNRVVIGDNITITGSHVFGDCEMNSVAVGCKLNTIAKGMFYRASLNSVFLPANVTSIDNEAFYGCTLLKNVNIPNSVEHIGISAFASSGLTSVVIPDSVTHIGNSAFYMTSDMEKVYLPEVPPVLDEDKDLFNSFASNLTFYCNTEASLAEYRTNKLWQTMVKKYTFTLKAA